MIPQFYKTFQHWGETGTVWIFSDMHFGDEDLKAGTPKRPDDETLLKNINSCVGKKDTFICLGDVGDLECARRIKGYKILICGNHDIGHTAYEDIFDEVYSGPLIVGEKILLSHEPVDIPWIFNFHGHDHSSLKNSENHFNCCADVVNYTPINFNKLMKNGTLSKISTLHRDTIDNATKKSKKRKNKEIK